MMFECANTEVIFDPDSQKLPTSPIQLIIVLQTERGPSVYCLDEKDIPPEVKRLYGTGGISLRGLHRGYFAYRVERTLGYSNKAATKFEIRDVPPERQIPDEGGVISR